ncbi:MAG: glycosyl hydrolase, partial [Actinomycetota bacterium]
MRFISAVVLAAGCAVVAACTSPAYPYSAAAPAGPAHGTIAKPVHARLAAVPDSILGVYNGGVPRSYQLVEKFASAVGRQPNVVMYFSGWGDRFQVSFARTALSHKAVPFVEMEPATVSMASIAAGRQDGYLRSYAQAVRGFGHPVMIGFAHEMNGFWYPWGWTHTRPKVFIRAWRHVVTVFRQAGADNVTWLWVVNGVDPSEAPIREWWPGSKYVSWVGMDSYYTAPTQTFATVFGPTLAAIHEFTHKPVLIAETGVGPVAGQAAKIPGLFAGVRARHLLGLVWFDKAQHTD